MILPHRAWLHSRVIRHPIVGSLGIALGTFAVALLVNLVVDQSNLSRIFLLGVLISAIAYGLWPSLFATLICVLIYDFFFIPPVYEIRIESEQDVINLILFAITAVIVSTLAARVRRYAIKADERALTAEKLAAFNRRVSSVVTLQEVLDTATEQMGMLLDRPVVLASPAVGGPVIKSRHPAGTSLDAGCMQALATSWPARSPVTTDSHLDCGAWHFLSLPTSSDIDAVIGIQARKPGRLADARLPEDPLLASLTGQFALAIERIAVRKRLEDARLRIESENLRSSLLAAISHDLRNPLAAIVGSASSLDRHWSVLSDEEKLALLDTIRGEAERLDVFIANLLDITRIEAGVVRPQHDAVYLCEVINAALEQAARVTAGHRVDMDLPADLPLVAADAGLLQQVIYYVIDNGAKYSPPGSVIRIVARAQDGAIRLRILDEGPGIPAAELELVFEKFYRVKNGPQRGGTGLGLAICRGFVEAMGGTIGIANRDDCVGTIVAIRLPTAAQPIIHELEPS
jgi:two-component system, OmpR family, sensor histidine kinase KdpD